MGCCGEGKQGKATKGFDPFSVSPKKFAPLRRDTYAFDLFNEGASVDIEGRQLKDACPIVNSCVAGAVTDLDSSPTWTVDKSGRGQFDSTWLNYTMVFDISDPQLLTILARGLVITYGYINDKVGVEVGIEGAPPLYISGDDFSSAPIVRVTAKNYGVSFTIGDEIKTVYTDNLSTIVGFGIVGEIRSFSFLGGAAKNTCMELPVGDIVYNEP